jgi:hypothetical protein
VSSRAVTIAGYLALLGLGVLVQVAATRRPGTVPPLQVVLARVMHSRPGRLALIAGWAWLGLHFFAR